MARIKPSQPLPPSVSPKPDLHTPISLSFRYTVRVGKEFCLSNCQSAEIRDAVDCLRQLTTLTWWQIRQTGGKKEKAGLGYTEYEDHELKHIRRPQELDPRIKISGVRASQKFRVFGAYSEHKFYILWFDREHKIVKAH